ncbi:Hypothetical predicted protein [Marmota monax]|uniref:C-type lectin domain-containing protein n=2 Tax=Marmota monax TaxID=9995 RepID=A0A5E4CKW1_MARMO|nr:Hypothetical predicted protein [Marmota monax]
MFPGASLCSLCGAPGAAVGPGGWGWECCSHIPSGGEGGLAVAWQAEVPPTRIMSFLGLGTTAKLQTTLTELGETQAKVLQQESALKELQERVTQGLAEAGRDRENVRTELFRVLEGIKFQNGSCEPCPKSWLTFQGSCYFFSEPPSSWEASLRLCANLSAHLVIIGGLEEQGFLSLHTRGLGYWLGLRAVRHSGKVQSYKWIDGAPLSFSHWNTGEPNDSRRQEDCVMMLHSGLWNDAQCSSKMDGCICEKRRSC